MSGSAPRGGRTAAPSGGRTAPARPPRSLRTLAPAKINLGLFVGPVRADGRHELVSVMQSISLADELTLEPAPCHETAPPVERALAGDRTSEPAGGSGADAIACPGHPELAGGENLAARALTSFRAQAGWQPGPLRLTIVKRVPVAAGMGGGSADAAAALRLAAHASGCQDAQLLQRIARSLGADVPAQVRPGRWLASGAGEALEALAAPSKAFGVLVLPLAQRLSTAAVYGELDRLGASRERELLRERAERLRKALCDGGQLPPEELLHNDLQPAAISLCPEIEAALQDARRAGADVALVSGSGPTVLGLFGGEDGPDRARDAADRLQGREPAAIAAVPVAADWARVEDVPSCIG